MVSIPIFISEGALQVAAAVSQVWSRSSVGRFGNGWNDSVVAFLVEEMGVRKVVSKVDGGRCDLK